MTDLCGDCGPPFSVSAAHRVCSKLHTFAAEGRWRGAIAGVPHYRTLLAAGCARPDFAGECDNSATTAFADSCTLPDRGGPSRHQIGGASAVTSAASQFWPSTPGEGGDHAYSSLVSALHHVFRRLRFR